MKVCVFQCKMGQEEKIPMAMERSSDTYLHKKFKKQLNIETNSLVHHEKENKDTARIVGSSEEKTTPKNLANSDKGLSQQVADNNKHNTVPNQSTNQEHTNVLHAVNLSKSSISAETSSGNIQSLNSSISYDPSNNQVYDERYKSFSFDTPVFRNSTQSPTDNVSSSVPDEYYYRRDSEHYRHDIESYRRESESIDQDVDEQPEDYSTKEAELQPMPDKNANGKYVCSYCNLVCSKPSVLQKHIRAHTNERPYPCTSCGFSFKTRSNLYKHCRSRTHANRVMGNKSQSESENDLIRLSYSEHYPADEYPEGSTKDSQNKPYKPRFHTKQVGENVDVNDDKPQVNHKDLSHKINEIINKNNSIVNSADSPLLKKRMSDVGLENSNNNDYGPRLLRIEVPASPKSDEPLNLSNKNRKRSMSEATEPLIQKSLIKELLLKNLSASDMQCPYCKMIFQTVTELDIHKLRTCKGKPLEAKYTRSSSVNVASILTKDRHAFDNIPQMQNTNLFPLNSPGPFLGKTRLVEGDKPKSFSFDTGHLPLLSPVNEKSPSNNYLLSPLSFEKDKKHAVRLFGGEVKVHNSSGETKSFRIDNKDEQDSNFVEYGPKISENRVVKSGFQSGGTVMTNKSNYRKDDERAAQDVIRIYENKVNSPNLFKSGRFTFETQNSETTSTCSSPLTKSIAGESAKLDSIPSPYGYMDMANFSQKAVKLLTPNIKQPFISLPSPRMLTNFSNTPEAKTEVPKSPRIKVRQEISVPEVSSSRQFLYPAEVESKTFVDRKKNIVSKNNGENTMVAPRHLYVNGKIVRHVPGIPGPVVVEESHPESPSPGIIAVPKTPTKELRSPIAAERISISPRIPMHSPLSSTQKVVDWMQKSPKPISFEEKPKLSPMELKPPATIPEARSPTKDIGSNEPKKFIRPNSLALKPTPAFSKQQHGLTPTIFNQILISPDTPRVAKKYAQHFLHGNYFSYLGLKSSTKLVYCTLNKTQPFYVPHFKRLSMYSEWRQQDNKGDKLFVSNYDSRQRRARYTVAGKPAADLIIHSSYKFIVSELPTSKSDKDEDSQKRSLVGGYECNDEYPYIRGRGRGKYVCEQCGIRCKKPSMLKKHIRTHSNDRPYTCSQCNFSFKTKGNLTKHMKSKSHFKNLTTPNGESTCSAQLSGGTPSSDSEDDDSGMDSSDESVTRKEEHEAAYGLLSLSQKPSTTGFPTPMSEVLTPGSIIRSSSPASDTFISTEEVAHVSKTNYAKNKILDDRAVTVSINFGSIPVETVSTTYASDSGRNQTSLTNYLGKTSTTRPLTYPYTSAMPSKFMDKLPSPVNSEGSTTNSKSSTVNNLPPRENDIDNKNIKQFHVIKKYASTPDPPKIVIENNTLIKKPEEVSYKIPIVPETYKIRPAPVPLLKINDVSIPESLANMKRKSQQPPEVSTKPKIPKNDEVMDLSVTSNNRVTGLINNNMVIETSKKAMDQIKPQTVGFLSVKTFLSDTHDVKDHNQINMEMNQRNIEMNKDNNGPILLLKPVSPKPQNEPEIYNNNCSDYDNSAMETLAEVATKQVKLEKNTLAKSVASEYLKLATQNENLDGMVMTKDVNDLMVKSEGSKSCSICGKSFSKPSQLRLHMNIHYLERPFRCDACSVSFRTKGHLQKHERSAGHYSKLSTSPAQSSSEPRPFKCQDCHIAFRIHGHLAKHLRSKLHIMKLECLAKIPFGLYAELERSNSLLTEINTSDADQCLESLKTLAKKVFVNETNKLHAVPSQVVTEGRVNLNVDSDS